MTDEEYEQIKEREESRRKDEILVYIHTQSLRIDLYEDLLGHYQSERDAETGSVHEVGYNSYTVNVAVDDL